MARSTSYLIQPPQAISQIRDAREKKLRDEIEKLRTLHGYSLGYRSIHALLMKKTISVSLYFVRKAMKLAGFFGLPKKRKYPKGNYSPEIENLIKGNFQSVIPHEKWFYRYHREEIPEWCDLSCSHQRYCNQIGCQICQRKAS